MKILREGASLNKEHLTVQWLSESITELRNEITELQESSSNMTKTIQLRSPLSEDINEIKDEIARIQLSLKALRSRQEKSERDIKELQDEAIQHVEDVRRYMQKHQELYKDTTGVSQTFNFEIICTFFYIHFGFISILTVQSLC